MRKPKMKPIDLAGWVASVGGRSAGKAPGPYMHCIETRAGALWIHPYDTWIACRFERVDLACKFFGVTRLGVHRLNPYSGKWNFHADWSKASVGAMVEAFKAEVAPLLLTSKEVRP